MSLQRRFTEHLAVVVPERTLEPSPSQVCEAARRTLDVDGADVVLVHPLTFVPAGASGPDATRAEEVQTTLGDGPSFAAVAAGEPVVASTAELARRWPGYHELLARSTPYASVMALPLKSTAGRTFAALDLYSTETWWPGGDPAEAVAAELGTMVSLLLTLAPQGSSFWLTEPPRRRQNVWIAIGMLLEATDLGDNDALAVLRAYAYAHDLTIDDAATLMTSGRLATHELL